MRHIQSEFYQFIHCQALSAFSIFVFGKGFSGVAKDLRGLALSNLFCWSRFATCSVTF
jgi:hypothetical protein